MDSNFQNGPLPKKKPRGVQVCILKYGDVVVVNPLKLPPLTSSLDEEKLKTHEKRFSAPDSYMKKFPRHYGSMLEEKQNLPLQLVPSLFDH